MADGYFVYLLRCTDGSLYTGITTDLKRRFSEHVSGDKKGAKYTKTHRPEKVAAAWRVENRSVASKLEWRIKHLTKQQKEALCEATETISVVLDSEEVTLAEAVELPMR